MTTTIVEVKEADIEEPRAYTADEIRTQIVDEIIDLVDYACLELDDDVCMGDFIATGVLDILSGENPSGLPQFDLVVRYPEELKKEDIQDGLNYYEDGMVVNTLDLSEMYFAELKALAEA